MLASPRFSPRPSPLSAWPRRHRPSPRTRRRSRSASSAARTRTSGASSPRRPPKQGLTIETVVFNDYTQPNEALERGEIDANAFQHQPYLDNQIKTQGYHIVPVGYTGVWPIGLYSKKYAKVADLPEGAVIGVPNDPSNEGRALRVLQNEGVIKLKDGTGILATTADIAENPKKIEIKELDAGIVGRSVEDLDAAVVNTDWALKSGLTPENRIAQEPIADNPYRNFIAVKAGSENEAWVKTLVASYQNETVKAEFDRSTRAPASAPTDLAPAR